MPAYHTWPWMDEWDSGPALTSEWRARSAKDQLLWTKSATTEVQAKGSCRPWGKWSQIEPCTWSQPLTYFSTSLEFSVRSSDLLMSFLLLKDYHRLHHWLQGQVQCKSKIHKGLESVPANGLYQPYRIPRLVWGPFSVDPLSCSVSPTLLSFISSTVSHEPLLKVSSATWFQVPR